MKFSRSVAALAALVLLTACKNPEDAATDLSRAAMEAQTAIGQAVQNGDIATANQLAGDFATTLRGAINDNFEGDFCSVPFTGFDCDSSKTAADLSDKSRRLLEGTARRYAAMRQLITDNTPVTDPALADFRTPGPKTAKADLIAFLAPQTTVQSRILYNSLTRSRVDTCKDMRTLSNEFERDAAYQRLTQPAAQTAADPARPLKGMVAIEGGQYDLDSEAFRPSGDLARAGRKKQTYKLSGRFRVTRKHSDVTVKIDVHNCKSDELRSFSDELRKRGDLANPSLVLKREIKVTYRARALKSLLTAPIPAPRDTAERLVKAYSNAGLPALRQERPFLVTVNFTPQTGTELTVERDMVVLPVDVTHLAYYPLTRPVVTDSMLYEDFYIGMPPHQVFGRTSYPSVAPLFQKTVDVN